MKSNIEKFVQTIPYGWPLSQAKIKVNDKGEIVIYGKETWHVKDIDAAIRQQLFHVIFHYEDAILLKPIKVEHPGQISQIENTVQKMGSLLESIETIQSIKVLKEEVTDFENNLKLVEQILTEREKKDFFIVKKVLIRAEKLLQERARCEKIITSSLCNWIIVYSALSKKDDFIKWPFFFDSVRKLRTIHVNPYRIRTQSPQVKFLQYKLYPLVKNDAQKAKEKLWQTIETIVPIYPGELKIEINGRKMIIQNGKILTQGRGG